MQIFDVNGVEVRLRGILNVLRLLPSIVENKLKLMMINGPSVDIITPLGLK